MTTTADKTLADVVDDANPNNLADALRLVKMGQMMTPQKRAISQASDTDVILDPPALGPASVTARVTGGAALAGVYRATDEGGTPVDSATLGVATLSADGTTLTFAAALTDVVVDYIPRSDSDINGDFNETGLG